MATVARIAKILSPTTKKWAAFASVAQRQGVLIALVLLVLFGSWRYDNFLSVYNLTNVVRYNSMVGLVALGMTFVIITGGIDLSVGSVAAFSSVVAAQLSPNGLWVALLGSALVGTGLGLLNGFVITRLKIQPFIATLAMLLVARGLALLLSNNASVSVDYNNDFTTFGQGNFLGLPVPALVLVLAYLTGIVVLKYTRFGLYVFTIGGNEETARLMGIKVDRIKLAVYTLSGLLAAIAGVILASQFGAGQPTEGNGWELIAIASVVVGGTLLTGGVGSAWTTLLGVFLLGLIFNLLNFENGKGFISLTIYWQTVIRGVFLLVVVLMQSWLLKKRDTRYDTR